MDVTQHLIVSQLFSLLANYLVTLVEWLIS